MNASFSIIIITQNRKSVNWAIESVNKAIRRYEGKAELIIVNSSKNKLSIPYFSIIINYPRI